MLFSGIRALLFAACALVAAATPALASFHGVLERAAEAAVSARDWDKARIFYKRALREAVRVSDREAILHLKRQVSRLPADSSVIARLIDDERYDEAFRLLKEYLNYNSGDVWAMSLMGGVYEAVGKNGQAERLYRKALKIQPEHPTPHYYYGRYLLLRKKKFEEALEEFRKYRSLLSAEIRRAKEPVQKKQLEKWRDQATLSIVSVLTEVLKRPEEAIRELEPLVSRPDADPRTVYSYGIIAMNLGRRGAAYQSFQKIIRRSPDSVIADQARYAIDVLRSLEGVER